MYNRRFVTKEQLEMRNQQLEKADPAQILEWGYRTFGKKMALGTGFGPSGVVLLHHLSRYNIPIPIFYLDTHLLFDETYRLKDELESRLDLNITRISPELSVNEQRELLGNELWKSDPDQCCYIRKVRPLKRYLSDKESWVTGVRYQQSETRSQTPVVQWDNFNKVVKVNPLA